MAAIQNFSVIQGDTFKRTVNFTVKNTGVPVDLTGSIISGKVKVGQILSDITCAIVDAPNGKFTFEISSTQTAAFSPSTGQMDVQVAFTDGTVSTIFSGNLVVVKQVS